MDALKGKASDPFFEFIITNYEFTHYELLVNPPHVNIEPKPPFDSERGLFAFWRGKRSLSREELDRRSPERRLLPSISFGWRNQRHLRLEADPVVFLNHCALQQIASLSHVLRCWEAPKGQCHAARADVQSSLALA